MSRDIKDGDKNISVKNRYSFFLASSSTIKEQEYLVFISYLFYFANYLQTVGDSSIGGRHSTSIPESQFSGIFFLSNPVLQL